MSLRELLPGARRRRKPRPGAPRTIVPEREPAPTAKRIDDARDRLRREIPPRAPED